MNKFFDFFWKRTFEYDPKTAIQEGEVAESTFWFGSEGSNVPCHFDSYGCVFFFLISLEPGVE